MKKNPNKKAGEWGALNNKPINQVYFKAGGAGPKQPKVITRGNKVIEKNGSYKIITKTKDTYGDSPGNNTTSGVSKAKRTLYGILHGAPKAKNAPMQDIKQVPIPQPEKTFYMKKGGSINAIHEFYKKKKKK